MDELWERSIPLSKVTITGLNEIFYSFNKSNVVDYRPIMLGCRNSNYVVKTEESKYLLRICPPNDKGYMNEKAAFTAVGTKVSMPKLLYISKETDRTYIIYEYIDAISMQTFLSQNKKMDEVIISQVATNCALIHNVKKESVKGLHEFKTPPFGEWYDYFLKNDNCAKRLGINIVNQIKILIHDHKTMLKEIDKYKSMIHCDYRPANMLVDEKNKVYIVDWEYFGYGHILADIGQFFRYHKYFDKKQFELFEKKYNEVSLTKLPDNWLSLCILRDLVNPLQMIGTNEECPHKFDDLKNIVIDILGYFNYLIKIDV